MMSKEMIRSLERLVLFSIFYILLRVKRLSVVIAWAFLLATRLTSVSLDITNMYIDISW